MNFLCLRMLLLQFSQQPQGRTIVDRLREIRRDFKRFDIHRTVDVDPLATAVGPQFLVRAALDPAIGRDAVMRRMASVTKIDRIVFALGFLERFVLFKKFLLSFQVVLAGHMLRFFINETKTMKQVFHTAGPERNAEGLCDVISDFAARQISVLVEVFRQLLLLNFAQARVTTGVEQGQQTFFAALNVFFVIISNGGFVEKEDFVRRDNRCRGVQRL